MKLAPGIATHAIEPQTCVFKGPYRNQGLSLMLGPSAYRSGRQVFQ